jgi:hypothetical protein
MTRSKNAWVVLSLAAALGADELPVVDGRPNVAIASNDEVALLAPTQAPDCP